MVVVVVDNDQFYQSNEIKNRGIMTGCFYISDLVCIVYFIIWQR